MRPFLNDTKICWCDYSWNPVTGCHRNCSYCYAREIAHRFGNDFSKITLHPHRLNHPSARSYPSKIFVGSMSDNEYWSPSQTSTVMDACSNYPHHLFLFLTKSPSSYSRFPTPLPKNCLFGLTLTSFSSPADYAAAGTLVESVPLNQAFISFEPLLGPVVPPAGNYSFPPIALIITGPLTKKGRTQEFTRSHFDGAVELGRSTILGTTHLKDNCRDVFDLPNVIPAKQQPMRYMSVESIKERLSL